MAKKQEKKPEKTVSEAPKTDAKQASSTHAGLVSPYDLQRRSGYKTIWQVLAENADKVVPWDQLHAEVNKRLAREGESKDWYSKNYADQGKEYDAKSNAVVINRRPYNAKIEKLKQRVIISDDGAMLATNVTTPRVSRRKKKSADAANNDNQ